MLVHGDNKKQIDFSLALLLFLNALWTLYLLITCFQDRLLPLPISLGMPLFTDKLDALQKYFHMLVGAYRKLGTFPSVPNKIIM